ncbi:uncharacterized protein LOC119765618 [Culex quinquefasciatus]|uniref:uncharacterized protein LOC119765618 n=1 Tax=Culex quinquefasciatus TaxID=7176 RepID=UPI0018E3D2A4|nr:uncharacterized protein LOC119765618 [Culex quinquefasciatus]
MVKVKIGARVFDTQGEEDQDRWLLLVDYGVERRQDATAESCSAEELPDQAQDKIVREGPSTMDPIRRAIREEYDRRKKELDLEFSVKADELKREFDFRRRMIIEAHLREKEEDFEELNALDECETTNEDYSEEERSYCVKVCGAVDFVMRPGQNGLGKRQPFVVKNIDSQKKNLLDAEICATRQRLSSRLNAKLRRWIGSRKRVRKKILKVLVVNPVQIFHRMLRAGVLAPVACTQDVPNLHSSFGLAEF